MEDTYFKLKLNPLITPKADSNHKITQMMTTALRIVLIDPAIGIKLLISHKRKPTITKTMII